MQGLAKLKEKSIFKYYFYQKPFKKNKKYYFLLDFFKGLKGVFFIRKQKKIKKKIYMHLFKSFNPIKNSVSASTLGRFDYFIKDFNGDFYNLLKKNKKKDYTRLVSYMFEDQLCFLLPKDLWLLQYMLNKKKLFSNNSNISTFTPLVNFGVYYNFLKKKLVINACKSLSKFFESKQHKSITLLSYKFPLLHSLFFFFNYEKVAQSLFNFDVAYCLYNKYNNLKSLKLLFINRVFKKLNRYFKGFKLYKKVGNDRFKAHIESIIGLLKGGYISFFSKPSFFLDGNKLKLVNAYVVFKEKMNEKKNGLLKFNFFFNLAHRLYISQYSNQQNANSILLKYYLYFYNFIIKLFIKLLNNFKFIIFNKRSLLIKRVVWLKIFLIFAYYKKILINKAFKKKRKNLLRQKKNVSAKLTILKFTRFIGQVSAWRKKIISEKLSFFLKKESYRLKLIKKIRHFKKGGRFFIYFKVGVLKKIYSKLSRKMNRMKGFKESGVLNIHKLKKFIKNNKLKKKNVKNTSSFTCS